MTEFSKEFTTWLENHAEELDQNSGTLADSLLERIAKEEVFKIGVPKELGGSGGNQSAVIEALTELGKQSLTAAFISWGHRTFIENILASSNPYPRTVWLSELITGQRAAGTGLSNAVKFLSAIEELNVTVIEKGDNYYLQGRLPWVTNLRSDRFVAVFAAGFENSSQKPIIVAVPSETDGLKRSEDLEFVALQGSNTAALTFDRVPLDKRWILSYDAQDFLAQTRPAFLGFQFGMGLGLTERALIEVEQSLDKGRSVLTKDYTDALDRLRRLKSTLYSGLDKEHYFVEHPKKLFQLRIDIVDLASTSLLLELQSGGGQSYFRHSSSSFIRRWNEGAFLPIVSPSAVQLRHILAH
ncbi:acyl-CoA dehydrogenase family protein [Streptococcus sp. H49]|uniref:acyl-CoA dehydrogenase family protein n=1 Tax=Streptococcus huangxiaojuni TaxID=3237239 RepID=UPI0034A292F0